LPAFPYPDIADLTATTPRCLEAGEGCGASVDVRVASSFAVSSPGSDRATQYAETAAVEPMGRGVLDSPPEPVIGLARRRDPVAGNDRASAVATAIRSHEL
jgi:hypothetical protein